MEKHICNLGRVYNIFFCVSFNVDLETDQNSRDLKTTRPPPPTTTTFHFLQEVAIKEMRCGQGAGILPDASLQRATYEVKVGWGVWWLVTTLKGGFADNQVSSAQNRIASKSIRKFFWVHIFSSNTRGYQPYQEVDCFF